MAGWTDLFIYFNSGLFKGGCQLHPGLPESLTFMTNDRGDWTQADVATIFWGQKQENKASVSSSEVKINKINFKESRHNTGERSRLVTLSTFKWMKICNELI